MVKDVQYSQYIVDHDLNHHIVVIDEGFTRITGYTQLDVKKGNLEFYKLIPEKDRGEFIQRLNEELKENQYAYISHPITCKDGSVTQVISFIENYKTISKRHICSKVLMTDVTVTTSLKNEMQKVHEENEKKEKEFREQILRLEKEKLQLSYQQQFMESMLNAVAGGIGMFEVHGTELVPTYLSDSFYNMLGLDSRQFGQYSVNFTHMFHSDDYDRLISDVEACVNEHVHTVGEFRFFKMQGGYVWLQVRLSLMDTRKGVPVVTAVFMDISERKKTEYELQMQAERFNLIAASNDEQMFEYYPDTDFMKITVIKNQEKRLLELPEFARTLERTRYIHRADIDTFKREWTRATQTPMKSSLDFRTKLFSTGYLWYRATYVSLANETEDGVGRIVGRFVNIESDVMKQQSLKQTAALDALTKLFNKGFTQAKINKHLYENQEPNALLIIDIDNFKAINDTFGHSYGDAVLKDVSRILRGAFRVNVDILGRIGGDEFIVLMNNPTSHNLVTYKAGQLCQEIRHTYEDNGKEVTISSSIGIAFYPEHGTDFQTLYKNADSALYNTKARGKNGYTVYDPEVKLEYHSDRK